MRHRSSFRDPDGYISEIDNEIYRFIHPDAQDDFAEYIESGLHNELVCAGLVIDHIDLGRNFHLAPNGWQTIKPIFIDRISYAGEWSFNQLLDAGLITLEIQSRALKKGFSLKDASSFNIQFLGSKPIFIDTLSFKKSNGNGPWVAYEQFCTHFLCPLALMSYYKSEITKLWGSHTDGVDISLTSALLPLKSWLNLRLLIHIHLHRLSISTIYNSNSSKSKNSFRLTGFQMSLTKSLKKTLLHQTPPQNKSYWINYRHSNTYQITDADEKLSFVIDVTKDVEAKHILDLGANDGHYSKRLSQIGLKCTAVESDMQCCEFLYFQTKNNAQLKDLLTLHIDLCNPTSNYGWASIERDSFTKRYKTDLVLALALIHHLSIGRNITYEMIASYLCELSENLIVEYIPPTDLMSQKMLNDRGISKLAGENLYGEKSFEESFSKFFNLIKKSKKFLNGRLLYQFKRKK